MAEANAPFAPDCYVPIMKAKQGELGALTSVSAPSRDSLVPLLEVREGSRQAAVLAGAWPGPNLVFVHPLNVDDHDDAAWANDLVDLFDALRLQGVVAVPVATTDDGPLVRQAIAQVILADGRGACLRIDAEEIVLASSAMVAASVGLLMADLGVDVTQCDLLLDVGLVRDTVASRVVTAEAGLRVIPALQDWRNLMCGFSAFPESIGTVAATGSVTQVAREDAQAYAALIGRQPSREPNYADYTVGVPFYTDIPWAPIPAIRYASGDNWFIHRGFTKQNRSGQYVQLATDVTRATYFTGPVFSAGDRYLSDVVVGADGPGNPMTYVRAAVSRHLACVQERLATLGVP